MLFALALGCLQSALLGGVIFGWASVSGTFLTENKDGSPALSSTYIHATFVVATFFAGLSPSVFGILQESVGPRWSSVIAHSFFIAGCLLFAASSSEAPHYMSAVSLMAFAGPGAHSAALCASAFFDYYRGFATVLLTASFQASFLVLFFVNQAWEQSHYTYREIFTSYAVVAFLSLCLSVAVWPDQHFDHAPPSPSSSFVSASTYASASASAASRGGGQFSALSTSSEHDSDPQYFIPPSASPFSATASASAGPTTAATASSSSGSSTAFSQHSLASPYSDADALDNNNSSSNSNNNNNQGQSQGQGQGQGQGRARRPSLRESIQITTASSREALAPLEDVKPYEETFNAPLPDQLKSRAFLLLLASFVASSFWANFFVGTASWQLGDELGREAGRGIAAYVSPLLAAGALLIPLFAFVMGRLRFGFPLLAAGTACAGILWGFLLLVVSRDTVLPAICACSVFRTALYAHTYSFTLDVFGPASFGALVGVLHAASGVVGLLQLPLAQSTLGSCHLAITALAKDTCTQGHWSVANLLLVLSSCALFFPAYEDWRLRYRVESRRRRITKEVAVFRRYGTMLVQTGPSPRYGPPSRQGSPDLNAARARARTASNASAAGAAAGAQV